MFDGVAARYDVVNTLLSLGLDRHWRGAVVRAVAAGPGDLVLDLGSGTGDLTAALAKRGPRVAGVDASRGMMAAARARHSGLNELILGSAFRLPFRDACFDAAASAFVLRNLDDLPAAFAELARVLRPGGRLAMADITEPASPLIRRMFDAYFGVAAPALGSLAGRGDDYRYLVRSVAHLPPATDLCADLRRAGFGSARARRLTGGIVTLFTATRNRSGEG